MKITGTRSYILIEYDHRVLNIKGELALSAFYASLSAINCWEPPFEKVKVTEDEKIELVKRLLEEQEKGSFRFKIIFVE
ncbi:hypothetical protein DVR12_17690 [Chitinophaga silvatica]|uniref:Uncharacterized protein n=1 Tax=Chitinophaga silvatica TaxID=2282649 RepID=A0A3E1Y7Z9_9BACT|nr:Imm74 family immunity protein [Chitinophaga silvatica]RFS21166.1 hypothetical protein DVR12_17690 [Chitinophaga silvatica]